MEFTGRIKKMLPLRSGISQRTGNEWKSLPFIFEYYEHDTDRYADSVLLETFDVKVIDNLKEGMEVKCGFSHHTREYEGKTYNEIRLYKIENVRGANQASQAANTPAAVNKPTPPFPESQNLSIQSNDDLPF